MISISKQNIVILFLVAFCTFFLSRMFFTPNLIDDTMIAIAVAIGVYMLFLDETKFKLKDDEEDQELFSNEGFTPFPDEPLDQQPLDEVAQADVEAEKSKPKRQRKKKTE